MAAPLFVSSGDLVADRRYQWALDYLKRGDPEAAADILEQVVETAPGFATAWFALATIREQMGNRDGAVAAFDAAAALDPTSPLPLWGLALALAKRLRAARWMLMISSLCIGGGMSFQ